MRWYVSIVAVLVLGLSAGSDIRGIAAPAQRPEPVENQSAPTVDIELVVAVDVSYSMDLDELAVQREGYAQAIVSREFLQALRSGQHGKIAVTYFEWSAS